MTEPLHFIDLCAILLQRQPSSYRAAVADIRTDRGPRCYVKESTFYFYIRESVRFALAAHGAFRHPSRHPSLATPSQHCLPALHLNSSPKTFHSLRHLKINGCPICPAAGPNPPVSPRWLRALVLACADAAVGLIHGGCTAICHEYKRMRS